MEIKEIKLHRYLSEYSKRVESLESLVRSFYMFKPHPSYIDTIEHIESIFIRDKERISEMIKGIENKTSRERRLEIRCENLLIDFSRLKDKLKTELEENKYKEGKI